jgi:hypothetical protein
LIAADALKNGRSIVDDVGHDVNLRILPGDELAVVPDVLRGLDGHEGRLLSLMKILFHISRIWPGREKGVDAARAE